MVAFIIISRIVLNLPWVGPRQAKAIGSPANNRSSVCPHRLPLRGWQRLRDSEGKSIGVHARGKELHLSGRVVAQKKYKGLLLAHSLSSMRTSSLIKIQ